MSKDDEEKSKGETDNLMMAEMGDNNKNSVGITEPNGLVRKFCQNFREFLPCLKFAKTYCLSKATGDLIAGLTTALTVIPQGIGYAPLAGLPLQYGLYASLVPGLIYALFGHSKEATIGPTAVNALLSFAYAGPDVRRAVTLAFFTGIVELLAGLLRLGFLIDFVSKPVISAFTSAVSIQVATSQLKGLLGLQVAGRGFVNTWLAVFTHFTEIRPLDASLGFACIGLILFLRKLKDVDWCDGPDSASSRAQWSRRIKWLLSVSRNCVVLLIATGIAYYVVEIQHRPDLLIITGEVEGGLPNIIWPWLRSPANPLHSNSSLSSNSTLNSNKSDLLSMAMDMKLGLIMLPLVSVLQHLAIVKFYTPATERVPASPELFALGAVQSVGSFFGSLSVTASFGRSAVNAASGVQTTFGGIITALIIILACAILTPHFAFIPTSGLAAVIIGAMIFTIDVDIVMPIYWADKLELVPFCLTFFPSLLISVDVGLIVGTAAHMAILVYKASSPDIHIFRNEELRYTLVRPESSLYFASAEKLASALKSPSENNNNKANNNVNNGSNLERSIVILDLSRVSQLDFTVAAALRSLISQLSLLGQRVLVCGANSRVEPVLVAVDNRPIIVFVDLAEAEQNVNNGNNENMGGVDNP